MKNVVTAGRKISARRVNREFNRARRTRPMVDLTSIGGETTFGAFQDGGGAFGSRPVNAVTKAFAHRRKMNAVVVIEAGSIVWHARGVYTSARTEITMTQAPDCYIYVSMPLEGGTPGILQSATWPASDDVTLRVALVHYEFRDGAYREPEAGPVILHEGNVQVMLPTR